MGGYPFGLSIKPLDTQGTPHHRWQFNGMNEREEMTGWDEAKYRSYDSGTGRFTRIDPKAEMADQEVMTPYHYSFNNPVRYNDPEGDCPTCATWLIGKIAEVAAKYQSIAAPGVEAFNNLVSGTSGSVSSASGMEQSDQKVMEVGGKLADGAKMAEATKAVVSEGAKDIGEVMDQGGEAMSDAAVALAPATEGASLVLVVPAEAISATGKGIKAVANYNEGNYTGAAKEVAKIGTQVVTNTVSKGLIDASLSVGAVSKAGEVAQKTAVNALESVNNKALDATVDKTVK